MIERVFYSRRFANSCQSKLLQLVSILILFFVFYNYWRNAHKKLRTSKINPNCSCIDETTLTEHDFCYHLPQTGETGRRFNCDLMPFMKDLGLVGDAKSYIDLRRDEMPEPVFVTAFSDNHFFEGRRLLRDIRRFWPSQKVVVYDLGLHSDNVQFIKELCNVEYRIFRFKNYPNYVRDLSQYRWKPIIIAETLKEFSAVWYMDSSIVFKKGDLSHVYKLLQCRKSVSDRPKLPTADERDEREEVTRHESSWDKRIWEENLKECRKSAYLFHGWTGHGIFPATSPHVYSFFPTNTTEIKKKKAKMYEAGFVFALRTPDTVEMILKWYVICALQPDCMSNGFNGLVCQFKGDRFSEYANCHRYDQSIVNLLAANAFHYDRHYYTSEIVDFFNVVRGETSQNFAKQDFSCKPDVS